MSAALQLPMVWGVSTTQRTWVDDERKWDEQPVARVDVKAATKASVAEPEVSLAFYRNHSEKMLRRYLYASMQVGRTPSILGDSVGRGWCSSRPVHTFEDAVIFVLDMETCLEGLGSLDREILSRVVLQEYTQAVAASLLGMSVRSIGYKLPRAVDHLTEKLLGAGLLVIPD